MFYAFLFFHYPQIAGMNGGALLFFLSHHGLCCNALHSNNNSLAKNPLDYCKRLGNVAKNKNTLIPKMTATSLQTTTTEDLERGQQRNKNIY